VQGSLQYLPVDRKPSAIRPRAWNSRPRSRVSLNRESRALKKIIEFATPYSRRWIPMDWHHLITVTCLLVLRFLDLYFLLHRRTRSGNIKISLRGNQSISNNYFLSLNCIGVVGGAALLEDFLLL